MAKVENILINRLTFTTNIERYGRLCIRIHELSIFYVCFEFKCQFKSILKPVNMASRNQALQTLMHSSQLEK